MAKITRAITLGHRANLGEEAEEVSFAVGDEVTVLKQWDGHLLCKNDAGQIFTIAKDCVEVG